MVTHHGQTFKLSDNVLVVLFAPDSVFAVAMHNVKNVSIVFKLTYGETSVLFTGDLEHEGDELLLPYENILKADILKIAHHGSITNTTEKLLYFIQPEYAIVSVGKKNKFKHPSQIVMQRLKKQNINITIDYPNSKFILSSNKLFSPPTSFTACSTQKLNVPMKPGKLGDWASMQ